MALVYLALVAFILAQSAECMTRNERVKLRDTVKDMFHHAYTSYMTYAYPADELMPLNCKGRYRDTEPSRGDVDDILGNFSMTLIDSLDSLVIFGEINKFEEAVRLVIDEVDFDNDIVVSTFETNIRVLGGLLGGHVAADVLKNGDIAMEWYNNELLDMAKDIGERLMPAFNTTTGIPYPKVNLMYGVADPRSRTGTESATCTACAGTMIMEFGALSRLTGDPKFETVAHKAMKALWTYRSRSSDLVGTVINIHNGEWVRRDSGVGAGIDSYYEYCLKAYILLGEEDYLKRFNQHYKAVMRYINRDSMFLNVHMNNPSKRSVTYMDSLQAFWPGLQVLKGDLQSAIELHEVFYSVAKRHTFLPEAFTTSFEVHWGQHFLRPELVESTYFLYEATKDPYYLDVGKYIVENLNRYTRVPCGFAAVKDVRTLSHENRMDSFLLSETLKYLYLLFTDKDDLLINLHDFVFTTEAHILPLALSNWNGSSSQGNIYESGNLHDHSCPSTVKDGGMLSFAEEIRRKSRKSRADGSCPKTKKKQTFIKKKITPPLLRAEQFIPGNKDHLLILKAMGISVTKTDDGKVQLMQDSGSADNDDMAAEGVTFMQSMIELAKFRNNDAEYLPRVVQILSPPYNGNIVLNAGPAQFGIDLGKSGMGVGAEVILADPFKGCTELRNKQTADHRIVVMERGECMFIDKVRIAEDHGAVGAIIIDNNEGSSSESQPLFAMSGDGSSGNINIPAVFLFWNEGQVLHKSMQIASINTGGNLRVRLGDKALKKDGNQDGTLPTSELVKTAGQEPETVKQKQETNKDSSTSFQDETADSQKLEDVENEVDKLINIMKSVVKQPGFEFLTKSAKLGATVMTGETNSAGGRERFLYDAMMENWRVMEAKEAGGKSQSGGIDAMERAKQAGLLAMKKSGMAFSQKECGSSARVGEDQPAVTQKGSEIVVVGEVGDGAREEPGYEVTTSQQVVDKGGQAYPSERIDRITESIIRADGSTKASDVLERDSSSTQSTSKYTRDYDDGDDDYDDIGDDGHDDIDDDGHGGTIGGTDTRDPISSLPEDPNGIKNDNQDDGHISVDNSGNTPNIPDATHSEDYEHNVARSKASFESGTNGNEALDENRGCGNEPSIVERDEINEDVCESESESESEVNSESASEIDEEYHERTLGRGDEDVNGNIERETGESCDRTSDEARARLHANADGETDRETASEESNGENEGTLNQNEETVSSSTENSYEGRTSQENLDRKSDCTLGKEDWDERTNSEVESQATNFIQDDLVRKERNDEINVHNLHSEDLLGIPGEDTERSGQGDDRVVKEPQEKSVGDEL